MKRPTQPGIAAAVLGVAVVVSIGPAPGSGIATNAGPADRPVAPVSRTLGGAGERAAATVDRQTVARWLAGVCEAERQWRRGGKLDSQFTSGPPAHRAAGCDVASLLRTVDPVRVCDLDAPDPPASPIRPHLGDLSPPVC